MSEITAPAETYALNPVAYAVGQFAIPNINRETQKRATTMLDNSIQTFSELDAPPVPHTDGELVSQAVLFDERVENQVSTGPARDLLSTSRIKKVLQLIQNHKTACQKLVSADEILVNKDDVAQAFGLADMWEGISWIIDDEVDRWGKETQHPKIPIEMSRPVNGRETGDLIRFMWKDVLQVSAESNVTTYLTDEASMYHLFWSTTASGLNYATPRAYDRATQLSFDLPHNIAHLAHLHYLSESRPGHYYDDSMAQRAYFEATAVMSEYIASDLFSKDIDTVSELASILKLNDSSMSNQALQEWLVQDRHFEFKLRAARLYADSLMIAGCSTNEASHEISKRLKIPIDQTTAEVRKYLPWTGLGAAYTLGYRKLLDGGIDSVETAILSPVGIKLTWEDAQTNYR